MSPEEVSPMAQPVYAPLFDALWTLNEPWTAQLALDLLPENNGPRVEIFRGSVIVNELVDAEYQPVVAAAAGGTFTMTDPFEFSIDPRALLDEEEA